MNEFFFLAFWLPHKILNREMITGKEPFKCGMGSAVFGMEYKSADYTDFSFICVIREICG